MKKNEHYNKELQSSFNKYGIQSFSYQYIPLYSRDEAYDLEDVLLKRNIDNPDMMNVSINSKFGDILSHNENRDKIIEHIKEGVNRRNRSMNANERKKIFGRKGLHNGMYGKHHSKEAKEKISKANKGNSYAKGRVMSDAQKAYISKLAHERTGEKNPFYGKHHSEKTKKRTSEANKRKKPVNMKRITVNGIEYESISECSKITKIHPTTLVYRLKSKTDRFKGYQYK